MAFAPLLLEIVGAAATVAKGIQTQQTDQYNAKVMANEQGAAVSQATAQSNLIERQGRAAIGRQAAAFGGAGVGYGGSSATALDQSAVNNELDQLNTKYKGAITGYGYGVQSGILNQEGQNAVSASALLAGGQALSGVAKTYSYTPQSPSQMSGVVSPQPDSGLGPG